MCILTRIGEASTTLKDHTQWTPSYVTVTQKEVVVPDTALPASQIKLLKRKLALHGFMHGIFWLRIDIHDEYHIRDHESGKVVHCWETTN